MLLASHTSPAQTVAAQWADSFRAFGATSVTPSRDGRSLTLDVSGKRAAFVAGELLSPTIDGVSILVKGPEGAPARSSWWGAAKPLEALVGVTLAMPGSGERAEAVLMVGAADRTAQRRLDTLLADDAFGVPVEILLPDELPDALR